VSPYPFAAVVGLDDLRLALLLNAVSPSVGGVLVRGEKGTAKSTVVRALADVLPELELVRGCRFACDPVAPDPQCPDGPHANDAPVESRRARLVELPVGASEDRLVGSLDLERVLSEGVTAYEPGLLAAAHRGLLYVDEVNLLHDHLVDLLLDAAAMGVAHVEREGVSVRHAARFLLVGTMNPEEGELRPQLLDRFGLTVEVRASREPAERAEVVRRRLAYEADPEGFAQRWLAADKETAARIAEARALLPSVVLPDAELLRITRICAAFEVDGMRADLVTARAATALAAWHGRTVVDAEDVRQAAALALPHRRRRHPFDAPGLDQERLDEAMQDQDQDQGEDEDEARDQPEGDGPEPGDHRPDPGPEGPDDGPSGGATPPSADRPRPAEGTVSTASTPPESPQPTTVAHNGEQQAAAPSEPFKARLLKVEGLGVGAEGRRSRARTEGGRTVGARQGARGGLHLVATVRAAAPQQVARGRREGALKLRAADLREPVREGREGNLVLFVVDASGSMAARSRMAAVKGAILSLLLDAYQRRDKVGLVTFRGRDAEVVLPPTWSVEAGAARLTALPTGGRTPVAAGLLSAAEVLRVERLRDPKRRPLVVVVTDGRATQTVGEPATAGVAVGMPKAVRKGTPETAPKVSHKVSRAVNSGRPSAMEETRRAADHLSRALTVAGGTAIVVDCESGPVRLGLATRLAADLGGDCLRLDELAADHLADAVRDHRVDHRPDHRPDHPQKRSAA
jgi:magnesium chelatase subunit D